MPWAAAEVAAGDNNLWQAVKAELNLAQSTCWKWAPNLAYYMHSVVHYCSAAIILQYKERVYQATRTSSQGETICTPPKRIPL